LETVTSNVSVASAPPSIVTRSDQERSPASSIGSNGKAPSALPLTYEKPDGNWSSMPSRRTANVFGLCTVIV
jgi:hypothetical protein